MGTSQSIHSGPVLARNVVLGFVAQAAPLLVALAALPVLTSGLGTRLFGAFQLAWVVLGYFAIFDLGLGRAANKFVAEYVARGEGDAVRHAVTGALMVQALTGVLGAGLFAAAVPTLVRDVLRVQGDLTGLVTQAFYLLAIALPAVLVGATYSGILQAVQRFDLVTRVQLLTSIATYGLPIVAIALGGSLTAVVGGVVAVRLASCAAYMALAYRVLPDLSGAFRFDWPALRRLATFGGWISVSNVATPVMLYLDRYVIASLLGLSAVAYYTAPYDVIVRLTIVPASVVPPLFSAFSAFGGVGDMRRLTELFARAAKYLVLTMAPIAAAIIVVAKPSLGAWLGDEFAQRSARPAQILALGMAMNAMAHLPFATLQAMGRADLPAKFHLVELPCYLVLLWALVLRFGITGAAVAWCARMTLDALLLYWAALGHLPMRALPFLQRTAASVSPPILAFAGIVLASAAVANNLLFQMAGIAAATAVGTVAAWRFALDEQERQAVKAALTGK